MFKNILLMLGHKDILSNKLISHLKSRTKKLIISYPNSNKKENFFNVKDDYYDFILCFRSKYILRNKNLKKAHYAAINFHPGPPEYKGIGCANYALNDEVKEYGVTSHLIMNNKIDEGKIIDVVKFKIKKKENIVSLLEKTNKHLLRQVIRITNQLLKNPLLIKKLTKKFVNIKWTNKIKKKSYLDKFYKINTNISKKSFEKKIRCTNTEKFKPYIILHKKTFLLK
tara:strand:- start:2065 stop:2742 length:678 start_codon:yes stop_codon:yes gene_type:complete